MSSVPTNRLLIVGNFLSGSKVTRSVCEELAARLSEKDWRVLTTSPKVRRPSRVLDMASTVWRERGSYDVAQVDVYSGKAFLWAELVCAALRRAGRPYVLTLHGGNLPRFARRWPGRVCRRLGSAAYERACDVYGARPLAGRLYAVYRELAERTNHRRTALALS